MSECAVTARAFPRRPRGSQDRRRPGCAPVSTSAASRADGLPGGVSTRVRWCDSRATVIVCGELDCASAPALTARLAPVVAAGPRCLVLDVAGVAFMDCAGLRPIVRARRALSPECPLIVRSPARAVRRLLAMTALDQVCVVEG